MKSLDEMSDAEALDAIDRMAKDYLSWLKGSGETLEDFYAPCETWIPRLQKILRKPEAPMQVLPRKAIKSGDYLLVSAPRSEMAELMKGVAYIFRDLPGLKVVGVPSDVTLEHLSVTDTKSRQPEPPQSDRPNEPPKESPPGADRP